MTIEETPPIFSLKFNKTPFNHSKKSEKLSPSISYIFMYKMRLLDHIIHSFAHFPSINEYHISGLCYTEATSAKKVGMVSGPLKPTAYEGKLTLSTTTTRKMYFNCAKYSTIKK